MFTSPYLLGTGGGSASGPPAGLASLMAERDPARFAGGSGGANLLNIAQFMDTVGEREKKKKSLGKAADYFKDAMGGDEWLLSQGIHPDQWDNLGAQDKGAAMKAMMEAGAEKRANTLAQEKVQQMMERGEEAKAWPELMNQLMQNRQAPSGGAPAGAGPGLGAEGLEAEPGMPAEEMGVQTPGPTAAASPGGGAPGATGAFSPAELMQGMAGMGKTNPRLAAALSRTLLPQLMGTGDAQPSSWQSAEGNPYVKYHNTLLRDQAPFDPSSVMGGAPEGYEAVPAGNNKVQYLKTGKTLPPTFHTTLDKVQEDISSAQATLQQPESAFKDAETAKTMRGYAQKRLDSAVSRGKATVDRYHSTGFLTDAQKEEMYGQLGVKAGAKPQASNPNPQGGQSGGGGVATPKTKAEFEKLGSGTLYVNPADGKTYKKK